jgi:hypothetical protein
VDCLGSVLTKIARLGELFADGHDQHLHGALGAVGRAKSGSGLARPVDAVQSLPRRVPHPPLNHRQTDVELACRFAQLATSADSFDHPPAALPGASARSAPALFFARNLNSLFVEYHPFGYLRKDCRYREKPRFFDP